ncbi:GDP-mannose pyrophosphatase [Jannaschia seohaensis]|uniref:Nudix-type nucleoside diphosphatase (YffH/AdpP family) n=1 Tax=Jannaschia seohaensis TaxID=475081 RepID=A0A2Y9C8J4_9RHOB|nr:GDP-mannose pyrophosphatase [Jannaschia seohaensis]PWJ16236.1 nudix-type nucleoside diphosphatase (YffH/AdpP family) [Jannaschia seohaensis]SSA49303.1 nudix-type nucleoside diphosphatase, YffH/AdpP family [Jannaschia seohaensis]
MDDFRPISTETLSDAWGALTRHRFALRRRDGTWDEQVREVYDHGHGAAALLHDPEADTVLLVRQFRLPLKLAGQDPYPIEAPAGLLENAAPAERMRAELMEETGYEARGLTHVIDLVMSPGSVTEHIACFIGAYTRDAPSGAGGGAAEEGEDIEVLHIPLPQALDMVRDGRISDAKTVVLIQHLVLSRGVSPDGGIG